MEPEQNEALEALTSSVREIMAAEGRQHIAVTNARRAGLPWEMIGSALGTSRQAAQQRFGRMAERAIEDHADPGNEDHARYWRVDGYIIEELVRRHREIVEYEERPATSGQE